MKEEQQFSDSENAASNAAETSPEDKAAKKTEANDGDSVKDTLNKAKEAAGQAAAQVGGKVQEKAAELVDLQKSNLAAGITAVADSVRHIGENLQNTGEENQIAAFAGKYGDTLAEQIEKLSHYVEGKDLREIASDAERLARRNPTLFVGGAFVLGILAARILKSSGSGRANGKRHLTNLREEKPPEKMAVQAS